MRSFLYVALLLIIALRSAGQVPPAYHTAGMAAFRERDYARCAGIFVEALRTEPKQSVLPAIGAARCYAATGDVLKTGRYMDMALERGYRSCAVLSEDAVFAASREAGGWDEVVHACRTNEERFYNGLNAEVFTAYLTDQQDRRSDLEPAEIIRRDAARRALVRMAIERKTLKTADDYYYAAMIMQHGETEDVAVARDLATSAVKLNPAHFHARWLYAAATDRERTGKGLPQIYGTQLKNVDGRWTLEPFDPTAITDEDRARWAVPLLKERLAQVEALNAPPPSQ